MKFRPGRFAPRDRWYMLTAHRARLTRAAAGTTWGGLMAGSARISARAVAPLVVIALAAEKVWRDRVGARDGSLETAKRPALAP